MQHVCEHGGQGHLNLELLIAYMKLFFSQGQENSPSSLFLLNLKPMVRRGKQSVFYNFADTTFIPVT